MIKKIALLALVFLTFNSFSQQKSINDFKYVIIPNRFDFLKFPDQHQVNSLTKFLFNKYGFAAFLNNETFPEDLANNKCLALKAAVIDKSSMFSTAVSIELKDCYNNIIFKTPNTKSKIKDYKKSYHEAIRKAFNSIKALNYSYKPSNTVAFIKEVKTIQEPEEVPFIEKEKDVPAIENKNVKVLKESKPIVIAKNILYAQPIKNGFQIVDSEPKIILKVLKSSKKEMFFIENKNGILYKKGNNWIAEYYENDVLIQKKYTIKF